MMVLVFLFLVLAFVLGWVGRDLLARLSIALCIAFAVGLFLWEIYSPQYGFAMPWLQG